MSETKKCTKCGEIKSSVEFNKNKCTHDGMSCYCKSCNKHLKTEFYLKNKEAILKKNKNYRQNNADKFYKYRKKWNEKNKEKVYQYSRNWVKKNSDRVIEIAKIRYIKYSKKILELSKNNTVNLTDGYIVSRLKAKGFKSEQIKNELIEVQRLIIKTKRLCKTSQN